MKQLLRLTTIVMVFIAMLITIMKLLPPPAPLLSKISFSQVIYDKNHHLLRITRSLDDKYRIYVPLQMISPHLVEATLLQEDRYFYWHFGINPLAVLKAGWATYIIHLRQIGASTITMQLARLYYGINSKKISGKLLQSLRALQLEMYYTKNQILEAYLNLAPYGSNIEGIGAASMIYLNKFPSQLTLPEALLLAVIPQNPSKRHLFSEKNSKKLYDARIRLFTEWLNAHPEDTRFEYLIHSYFPIVSKKPSEAPHLVNTILQKDPYHLAIITTLDLQLQHHLEQIAKGFLLSHYQAGIHNLAALLVDSRNMEVKALLGSANFFARNIHGQINGTHIKRSPGSSLQPFIYALAQQQGITNTNNARITSIMMRLQRQNLYEFLRQAHIRKLKPQREIEVTMQELVKLYAMLANDGWWYPLRLRITEPMPEGIHLLNQQEVIAALNLLKQRPNKIYWNTTTTAGHRDAWAVGLCGPYVLAVWIGDFNGKGNPVYNGNLVAAPLFWNIVTKILETKLLLGYNRFSFLDNLNS